MSSWRSGGGTYFWEGFIRKDICYILKPYIIRYYIIVFMSTLPTLTRLFSLLQNMGLPSVIVLPLLIVVAAGVYYIYNEILHFMSKSLVRNKVVVITDAVSGVGTGKGSNLCFYFLILL